MKIMSFNIRQWTRDKDSETDSYWRNRMEAMKMMLLSNNPDIICFQEFLAPVGKYVPDKYKRVGISVSHPIYIRKNLEAKKHRFAIFWEACTVSGIRIINVHTRWEDNILQNTINHVNKQLTGCDIACGDWNNSLSEIKKRGLKMSSARQLLGIQEVDTFVNFKKPESHGAIDHFFVNGIRPYGYEMITCGYGVDRISDHNPIILII